MDDLLERLRAVEGNVTKHYRNPDGPEAAVLIEQLTKRVAGMTMDDNAQLELPDRLVKHINMLKSELEESARLHGAGSSREARLQARVRELEHKIEILENECYKKCGRCEFDYGSAAPKAAPQ